jgi:PAS domain S-box-containing protein
MKDSPQSTLRPMASSVTTNTPSPKPHARAVTPAVHPFEAMLDALPVFALLAQPDGAIVYCNDPLARICGWKQEAQRPRHLDAVVSAEDAQRLLRRDSDATVRAALKAADGAAPMVEWSSRPLATSATDDFALITGRDVSREAQLEDYVIQNQWFETAAALSGGLAHDFNNVLAAILGLSEIISLRLPPENPLQEYAGKIGISIERAKLLVRRYSQFSRKSAGGIDAQPTAMVLDELGKLLHGFLPGSVTLAFDVSPDTPWCNADRYILDQIILNCANFLRSRLRETNGSVVLGSRASADGRHTVIELRGSGQGLLALDIEPFLALDLRPTASAYESGAGLYVARILAARQGASLSVKRHDPRTISFVLQVPVAP